MFFDGPRTTIILEKCYSDFKLIKVYWTKLRSVIWMEI